MFNRTAIMKAAWARYRAAYGTYKTFYRICFREALRIEWKAAKYEAKRGQEQARRDREYAERAKTRPVRFMGEIVEPPMSEMEARIDALKYLSFRYNIAAMERAIRAEYAARA